MKSIKLVDLKDLKECEPTRIEVNDDAYLVVLVDGEVYVLDDCCSHEYYRLSVGYLDCEEKTVECEKHGSSFSLLTGDALSLPATEPVKRYLTEIKDGAVYLIGEKDD